MTKSSFRRATTWLTVALVVAVGYSTLAYQPTPGTHFTTLTAFPEDCDITITVGLLEACDSLDSISWALEEITGYQIGSDQLLDWLQHALADMGSGAEGSPSIDLKTDILPWIGSDATVGVDFDSTALSGFVTEITGSETLDLQRVPTGRLLEPSDLDPDDLLNYVMVAVSCRDASRVGPFLDKLEAEMTRSVMPPITVTIDDYEWLFVEQDAIAVAVGVVGDQFIVLVAPLTKVFSAAKRVVDTLESGTGSIASSADYQRLDRAVGHGGAISMYANLPVSDEIVGAAPMPSVQAPETIRSLVRLFADGSGVKLRLVEAFPKGQYQYSVPPGFEDFDVRQIVLKDSSASVPGSVVGFVQFGSIYEYWTIMRSAIDHITVPIPSIGYEPYDPYAYEDPYEYDDLDGPYSPYDSDSGAFDFNELPDALHEETTTEIPLSDFLPAEMLSLLDTLLSHFVGDTHVALTGNASNPMVLGTVRVEDGEMLVSYLELLVTQMVPGLRISFSHHSDEMVKTISVDTEEGLQSVVSYCLVGDVLVVSNMEPAVRLAVDTAKGVIASVEESLDVADLRSQIGDGGLVFYNLDGSRLTEFLRPLEAWMPESEARWIQVIDRVFRRMSGYISVDDDLCYGQFELILRPRQLE